MNILRPFQKKTARHTKRYKQFVMEKSKNQKLPFEAEWISPLNLILKQTLDRYDFIIRDLAIGELLGENDIGLNLWKKLSGRTRVPYDQRIQKLKWLMENFEIHGGFKIREPIGVDEHYQLWGAAHRIVLSIRWNILELPILRRLEFDCREGRSSRGLYSVNILRKIGYSEEEIEFIITKYDEYIKAQRKAEQINNKKG